MGILSIQHNDQSNYRLVYVSREIQQKLGHFLTAYRIQTGSFSNCTFVIMQWNLAVEIGLIGVCTTLKQELHDLDIPRMIGEASKLVVWIAIWMEK